MTPVIHVEFYVWTHGARDTAQNQSRPGSVMPIVISTSIVANLGHGNLASSCSVGFLAMCRLMAKDRPLM